MVKVLMCGNHPSNRGGMTSVISQIRSYDWKKENIQIRFIPTFHPGNCIVKAAYFAAAYVRVILALLFFRPDIVHMHMSFKGSFQRKYLIHKLCRKFHVKDMIHLHGSEFEKWFDTSNDSTQKKIRCLLKECDAFLVLGEQWETAVKKIEPSVNTVVLRNSIAIPDTVVQWNEEYCRILYLGVLIKRKGLVDLLCALDRLKERHELKRIRVSITGSGPDEAQLKEICRQRGLEKYVEFNGWVSGEEKVRIMEECQVAVLPSYNEGLPVSILEEIAYGMPVVATDVGDVASAVHDGENGYLITPGDIDMMACRLEAVTQKDNFIRMSQKSREIAEELFSEKHFFKTLRECYLSLTGK